MLEVLCGFPSRGVLRIGEMGEGSELEGGPGAPLPVYCGSSQSEEYRGDHRPLSSANSCTGNVAATAGRLRLLSGICAARNQPAKGAEDWKSTRQVSPTSTVPDSEGHTHTPPSPAPLRYCVAVMLTGKPKGLCLLGAYLLLCTKCTITYCSFFPSTLLYRRNARPWASGGEPHGEGPCSGADHILL